MLGIAAPLRGKLGAGMSMTTLQFLTQFRNVSGQFNTPIPAETIDEQMVREFEAGIPAALETMKLILSLNSSKDSTETEVLARWKESAELERSRLRPSVGVRHAVVPTRGTRSPTIARTQRVQPEDFVSFFECVHSARIFVPDNKPAGGLIFYPVSQQAYQLEYVGDWLEEDEEGYQERIFAGELEILGYPPWLHKCIAFAGVGQSAERFLLACGGPYRGSVLGFDHDPLGMRVVALSFGEFLMKVIEEPLVVANWVGIYGADRYEDAA